MNLQISELTLQQQVELYLLLFLATGDRRTNRKWLALEERFLITSDSYYFKRWTTSGRRVSSFSNWSKEIAEWIIKQNF